MTAPVIAMTGNDLYEMVTGLNGEQAMDPTLFYNIATLVQEKIETARNWMWLRKRDSSLTITPADVFQTGFTLPDDFNKWQSRRPIVLVDPGNSNNFISYFQEVPFAEQFDYQFQTYRYCCDYPNNLLYILGNVDRSYTIQMNYLRKPPVITATTSWAFPAQYHPLLAYAIVAQQKGGIDFDEQNARMAQSNDTMADLVYQSMVRWDDQLQEMSVEGTDPAMDQAGGPVWIGGHVNINGGDDY